MDIQNRSAIPENASALVRRLGQSVLLTRDEVEFLEEMQVNQACLEKGDQFVRDGEPMRVTFLVREGWAMRYKITAAGRRQIIGIALPGDFIGLHVNFAREAVHSAAALTNLSMALIEPSRILEIHRRYPVLASGLDWITVRHANILAEHNVSLGARPAAERLLHFLLELWSRLSTVGEGHAEGFKIKLNQEQLADVLGMTPVHVSRCMSSLSKQGLVKMERGNVHFPDPALASEAADFDSRYLASFTTRTSRLPSPAHV